MPVAHRVTRKLRAKSSVGIEHRRFHENLQNLTAADIYFRRSKAIRTRRKRIKRQTIKTLRLLKRKSAA